MQTFSAPLAIIKIDGVVCGKARNIRGSESYRRGRVTGIGRVNASELPLLEFTGTLSMGYYNIDFKNHPTYSAGLNGFNRKLNGVENLINALLLQEKGFDLILLQKTIDTVDPNKIIKTKEEEFLTVRNIFITGDNFDLSEGQLSGRDSTFEYTDPIFFQV